LPPDRENEANQRRGQGDRGHVQRSEGSEAGSFSSDVGRLLEALPDGHLLEIARRQTLASFDAERRKQMGDISLEELLPSLFDGLGSEQIPGTIEEIMLGTIRQQCQVWLLARRTSEIGIRMALGATRSHVVGMVLRESLLLVLAGIAIGVPIALACARFAANRLFGVGPADPLTFVGATVLMVGVAAVASGVPSRRAARVDPMVSLRHE